MFLRGGRRLPFMRRALIVLPIWSICTLWMWSWWLQPERINYAPLFIALTFAMLYEFVLLPSIFLYFVMKAKTPMKRIAPKGKKVAIISLCVPEKESIDIVEKQLAAMQAVKYPHDSWILDEGNSKQIKILAKKYGVKYFSRKGIRKYNQQTAPFQAKTKAGNVNAWLDHVKRRKYEYFVQLDIDHLPSTDYLDKTLGHFRDNQVGWVQAPSVYNNLQHWTARGAAEQELVLQGPLQMGFYGHSRTPFIIGSHCTYRTSAIKEIGGFQPTRAEDHLDTVALASKGYKGVFIPQIIAEGNGPETLTTYLAQQFAWAYSMFQVLLFHSPKLLETMPLSQKWQFLFAQTWYPLWSLSYFVMFLCPVVALLINRDVASLNGSDMLAHFVPMFACTFLIWWASRPLMQPKNISLSWRGMILHAVRWPVILRAILSALFRIKKPYMITPKGKFSYIIPSAKLYRPFILLGSLNAIAIVTAKLLYGDNTLESQSLFALSNALFMAIICAVDINLLLRQSSVGIRNFNRVWLKPVSAVSILILLIANAFAFLPSINHARALAINNISKVQPVSPKTDADFNRLSTEELIEKLKALPDKQSHPEPTIGLFNPDSKSIGTSPYIEHVFIDWNDVQPLASHQYRILVYSNNTPMITLEPRGQTDGAKLLADIANGNYDAKLKELANVLGSHQQTVYVRFAHEMDLADLYPWGNQDPETYNRAFRYTVNYFRSNGADNVKWIWSPAGNSGAQAYYPGDDVVDVIGTTILYDQYFYGQNKPSFYQLADQRVWMKSFGKPLWIVEFGVGNQEPTYQTSLINEALRQYNEIGFNKLIYLNIPDSNILGPNYTLADLSIIGINKETSPTKKTIIAKTYPREKLTEYANLSRDDIFSQILSSNK
jgi:cellulose synthase (UDP-forming)